MQCKFCEVSPEGDKITITQHGKSGALTEITLSFDEASALAITLPGLLTVATGLAYADATLRYTYPVRDYTVEGASDHRHVLLTLTCGDGFDVGFSLDVGMVPFLTRDLAEGQALLETSQPGLPN